MNDISYDTSSHPGIFGLMRLTMKGPNGRWMWLVILIAIIFTVLFFMSAVSFWNTTDTLTAVKSGMSALFFALIVMMIKLWAWLEMQKISLYLMLQGQKDIGED